MKDLESGYSRRDFLHLGCFAGAGLGLIGVLAACGSQGEAAASPSESQAAAAAKSSVSTASPSSKASGAKSLTAAYSAPIAQNSPFWIAASQQTFAKYGIEVTVKTVPSNAIASSLLSRQVDVLAISAAQIIPANLNGSLNGVFVGSWANHAPQALYVSPKIRSAADLKGKTLAASKPGNPNDYAMHAALKLLGLSGNDVKVLAIGTSDLQYAALTADKVQGAILGPPYSFKAEDDGFRRLQDILSVPYQALGPVMVRSRLEELAPVIPGFLEGLREGVKIYNSQPEVAMDAIKKYSKEEDPEILRKTYEYFRDKSPFQADLQPTLEGIQAVLDYFANNPDSTVRLPAAKTAKPSEFVDTRFLKQMRQ
jgi:NitT/TauT family transport system substrate-binding protein